jgi:hypothetical protein
VYCVALAAAAISIAVALAARGPLPTIGPVLILVLLDPHRLRQRDGRRHHS